MKTDRDRKKRDGEEKTKEDRDFSSREQRQKWVLLYLSLHFRTLWKEAGVTWRIKKKKMHLYRIHSAKE